jgi:osmotically-inducible protein OsmY
LKSYCCPAVAFVLLVSGLGAAQPATKPARPAAHKSAVSTARGHQASVPDAQLEKAIREKFAASKISSDHFQVHVQGGVATLEGQTGVLQHKGTATRLAKNLGAARVKNNIQVSEAAREKASRNLAKGRRRAQIKRSEITPRNAKRSL